ncbi:MAG: tRNA 4-thiouridine(8) synthase ThiI [Pseudomonadota bacterium]|nr:tRNA 4-thiouridine(8) synthase ThiI [Pseudomonadota bacterium]
MPIPPDRILIRYGEIALKGRSRPQFENTLMDNLRRRLDGAGVACPVRRVHVRVYVDLAGHQGVDPGLLLDAVGEVAGVAAYAPALFLPAARGAPPEAGDALTDAVLRLARDCHVPGRRFAVRVNRADKRFPVLSHHLERSLGSAIIASSPWREVNLKSPEQVFRVDIHPEGVYLYAARHKGVGGLPVGSEGHVLCLLSGGIDSPTAAWLMAKRGCRVDFLHMTAAAVGQPDAAGVVAQLVRRLSRYTLRSRLYLVPALHFDLALMGRETGYDLLLFRRFLARTGQILARRIGARALVSGDSLGQVASQTLDNLITASRAVADPILRPLLAYDKQDIVALARRIGTYEISIQPYKDCCALLSGNPVVTSVPEQVAAIEAQVVADPQALVEATLADARCLTFACGERVRD